MTLSGTLPSIPSSGRNGRLKTKWLNDKSSDDGRCGVSRFVLHATGAGGGVEKGKLGEGRLWKSA